MASRVCAGFEVLLMDEPIAQDAGYDGTTLWMDMISCLGVWVGGDV